VKELHLVSSWNRARALFRRYLLPHLISIQEIPATPSNIRITQGGGKFGDFDPSFSHIEMRDWSNGRGQEYLSDDPAAFYDGTAWTLTPGSWHQPPMWGYARNFNKSFGFMPGNEEFFSSITSSAMPINWRPLISTAHQAVNFKWDPSSLAGHIGTSAQLSTWVIQDVEIIFRKIGSPPNLHVGIFGGTTAADTVQSSLAEDEGVIQSTSIEPDEVVVYRLHLSSASSGVNLSSIVIYPTVEVYTTVAGSPTNRWDIAYSSVGTSLQGFQSSVGTSGTWSTNTENIFFRVSEAQIRRKWHLFQLKGALYAIDERDDGGAPTLMINGDRGKASSGSNSTQLTVTNATWQDDPFTRSKAFIRITAGTGAGQFSPITNEASTALRSTWAIAPTSDSEFVIYGTHLWHRLSTALASSIGGHPVRDVAVADDVAYFAFGNSTFIGKLDWNSSVHQAGKNSTYFADRLDFFNDPVAGPQLWRGISSLGEVSRGDAQGFSTDVTFSTAAVKLGGAAFQITNLEDYNDQMYVFKEDSIWVVKNDRASKLNVGLDAFTDPANGQAVLAQNLFLYMNWSHSLERLYSGTLDDIGPWKGAGIPAGRQGAISALAPIIAWTAAGINAGTGQSAAMLWNNRGWHEIFREWGSTQSYPIENLYLQGNPGTRPTLWISVGGEMVWMRFPAGTLNPVNDTGMRYWLDGHIISPTIDMGVSQLPKLFHEVHGITRNLNSSLRTRFEIDYQVDENVGSTGWLSVGDFLLSPADSQLINRGDKKQIRLRFRSLTGWSATPVRMDAAILKSVARTPVKRQWNIRAEISSFNVNMQGLPDAKPDALYQWLQDMAVSAKPLNMHASWLAMDNVLVFSEPPIILREFETPDGSWGAVVQITLREI
jgi:hypothetical protein